MVRGSAKVVTILDTSSSMRDSGVLAPAMAALRKLVGLLQPGDQLAIVSADRNAGFVYPASGTLKVRGSATSAAVAAALEALSAGGDTDIGAAVAIGSDLLRESNEPRALVLLSDGAFDPGSGLLAGRDPALRVFTAAFGNHGDRRLLRDIAGATGGSFLFAPGDLGLASLYFDILAPSQGDAFR